MNNFLDALSKVNDMKLTENGAVAYKSSGGGKVLDLFSIIGGLRDNPKKAVEMWKEARNEDKELADNLILYVRNIRDGGLGEREIGKQLLLELSKTDPNKVIRNFSTIVENGRWDDLLIFLNTHIKDDLIEFIKEQWVKDLENMLENKPISLLAKWLPSANASSKKTRAAARKIYKSLNLNEKSYRITLSLMREKIDIVEKKMSSNQWNNIKFEKVPSVAMNRYSRAFKRHENGFDEYLLNVKNNKAKINSSTLYPYDICRKYFYNRNFSEVDEEQWKALPNYVDDKYNVLIMADVSGSMCDPQFRPISTSIGLATYFAQRNKGSYHNSYLTFTNNPYFIKINDKDSLANIFQEVCKTGVGYSTNFDRAMKTIFNAAEKSGEVPDALVVISDCEIDKYKNQNTYDIFEKWDNTFKTAGFKGVPKIVFWNVNSSKETTFLARENQNVCFVSGYGIGPFKQLNSLINDSPYETMVKTLNQFQWK